MATKKSKTAYAVPKVAPVIESDDIAVEILSGLRADSGSDDVAMFVGSDEMSFKIRGVISTQCPTLDKALGRGGFPLGRLTIVHGKEGSGKTTLLLHGIAECQAQGGLAIIFDKEFTLDPDYASSIGVNTSRLIISQDGSLEDVITRMHSLITRAAAYRERTGRRVPVLIGLDSINATLGRARLAGEPGDAHIGVEARIWSEELPKLLRRCYHEDIALVFISQIRAKIGIMFGDADDIAGGNAPKFYASVILKITPTGAARETAAGDKTTGEDKEAIKVGYMAKAEAKKNKIAPPFRQATFLVRYGRGIDFSFALLEAAEDAGIVEKSGAWWDYNGEHLGNGAIKAAKFLDEHPEIAAEINGKFRAAMGWSTLADVVAAEDPSEVKHSVECLESDDPNVCVDDCPVAKWHAANPSVT